MSAERKSILRTFAIWYLIAISVFAAGAYLYKKNEDKITAKMGYGKKSSFYSSLEKNRTTGLMNVGNSCYLNAILHVYFNVDILTEVFSKMTEKDWINAQVAWTFKSMCGSHIPIDSFFFAKTFARILVKRQNKEAVTKEDLEAMLRAIQKINPTIVARRQNDPFDLYLLFQDEFKLFFVHLSDTFELSRDAMKIFDVGIHCKELNIVEYGKKKEFKVVNFKTMQEDILLNAVHPKHAHAYVFYTGYIGFNKVCIPDVSKNGITVESMRKLLLALLCLDNLDILCYSVEDSDTAEGAKVLKRRGDAEIIKECDRVIFHCIRKKAQERSVCTRLTVNCSDGKKVAAEAPLFFRENVIKEYVSKGVFKPIGEKSEEAHALEEYEVVRDKELMAVMELYLKKEAEYLHQCTQRQNIACMAARVNSTNDHITSITSIFKHEQILHDLFISLERFCMNGEDGYETDVIQDIVIEDEVMAPVSVILYDGQIDQNVASGHYTVALRCGVSEWVILSDDQTPKYVDVSKEPLAPGWYKRFIHYKKKETLFVS